MMTIRCTHEKKPGTTYTLLVGQTYTVGRKGGDISFPEDQSVSRNHAEMTVEHPSANLSDPLLIPMVVITDMGSKFGTFANDGIARRSPMSMREPMNLSPNDRFRFGLQWNEYEIIYQSLVVTPSALKEPSKLKTVIMTLGGHMVAEWIDKVDYVVMDVVTLTIKAVCALLSAKHIVLPSFFSDLLECVQTKKGQPNPSNFTPPLGEKSLRCAEMSLEPNVRRTELFKGKTFMFAHHKHLRKMGVAVKCGGGVSVLLSSVAKEDVANPNFVLMTPSQELALLDKTTVTAIELYKKAKKRVIQDSEIGLAAVYNSVEKFCNPNSNVIDGVFPKLASQTQESSSEGSARVLAPETQDQATQRSTANSESVNVFEDTFIANVKEEPHSGRGESEASSSGSSARKRTEAGKPEEAPQRKKRSAEEYLVQPESSSKRLCSQQIESEKALCSLFGLSDEEDVEIGVSVDIVPDTQDQIPSDKIPVNVYSVDIVPDSPDQIPSDKSPLNVSSVDIVPDSPDQIPSDKSLCNVLPTDKIPDTRGRNQMPSDKSPCNVLTTDIIPDTRGRDQMPSDKSLCNVSIIVLPVIQASRNEPTLEVIDGRMVKNYKTFKKVLTLSQQREKDDISGKTSSTANSAKSFGAGTKLTFEVYEYQPVLAFGNRGPSTSPKRTVSRDEEEPEDEPQEMDVLDEMTVSASTSAVNTRPKRFAKQHSTGSHVKKPRYTSLPPLFPTDDVMEEDDVWGFN